MLTSMSAPTTPLANLIATLKAAMADTSYGTVRTVATADAVVHQETEITIRREKDETFEAFVARAWPEIREGDFAEWAIAKRESNYVRIVRRPRA
jgi:hypothetical protein